MSIGSQELSEIRKHSEQFFAALRRGDVTALEDMHADNAVVLPPNRRIIQGADIQAFWRNMAAQFQNLESTTVGVEPLCKEAAREIGRLRFTPQGEDAEPVLAKYLILWHHTQGSWKISSIVWNRRETDQQRRRGRQ
jgi:ketosteroid isomerase-like protein